jgi:heme oxygenase
MAGVFSTVTGQGLARCGKSFQAKATDYCVTEGQIAEAVNGAKSTFRKYRDSMIQEEPISRAP